MPGHPTLGSGLIRSHDLFAELTNDVYDAYALLEQERESQFLRRCVARSIFAYIEATIECIRIELRSTLRHDEDSSVLSKKDTETLGSLSILQAKSGKFIPLEESLKRTFKLAIKIWKVDHHFSTSSDGFKAFVAAKSSRNSLTHPKTYYDIEVTDIDMHFYSFAFAWVRDEFVLLLRKRWELFIASLNAEDQAGFRKHLTGGDSDA